MTEDHSLAALMAEPMATEWGRWELEGDGSALRIMDGNTPRYVDLSRCVTGADRWFWVKHYAGKGWVSPQDVADLVAALVEIEYHEGVSA